MDQMVRKLFSGFPILLQYLFTVPRFVICTADVYLFYVTPKCLIDERLFSHNELGVQH